eukprot:GHRQ01033843.1.p1 GENE.GHRQ01033843.1~~GHRQ01033843.1.p1  ORF type:complete len:160 (+),score=30.77 GHRQ01033843.1:947-1426(+)
MPATIETAPNGEAPGGGSSVLLSVWQVSFIVAYFWAIGLYVYSLVLHRRNRQQLQHSKTHQSSPDIESKTHEPIETTALINGDKSSSNASKMTGVLQDFWSTPLVRCMLMDQQAVMDSSGMLLHMVEFGTILVWFFMCDRTNMFWQSEKVRQPLQRQHA